MPSHGWYWSFYFGGTSISTPKRCLIKPKGLYKLPQQKLMLLPRIKSIYYTYPLWDRFYHLKASSMSFLILGGIKAEWLSQKNGQCFFEIGVHAIYFKRGDCALSFDLALFNNFPTASNMVEKVVVAAQSRKNRLSGIMQI